MAALFDGEELLAELRKLLQAHRSPKLFMPSDVHFLLLHEVLQHEIERHNDRVFDTGQPVACGDVRLLLIDFDFVRDFFWDLDFLLEPEVMERVSEKAKERLGFNPELFGVVQGLKPHPQELELKEVRGRAPAGGEPLQARVVLSMVRGGSRLRGVAGLRCDPAELTIGLALGSSSVCQLYCRLTELLGSER